MQLPPKPLHLLAREEQVAYFEDVNRELARMYTELSQVKIQYMWAYGQAYKSSVSSHVSGRIQEAEIAAAAIMEDQIDLEGQIDALQVMNCFISQILHD